MTDNLENEAAASSDSNSASSLFSGSDLRTERSEAQADVNDSAEKSVEIQPEAETKPEESQPTDEESEKIVITKEEKDAEAIAALEGESL